MRRSTTLVLTALIGLLAWGVVGCQKKESAKTAPNTISGTVTIAPDLEKKLGPTDVLFVVARPADAPPFGPPVAAKKITPVKFPQDYTLSQADVFFEGVTLSGKLNVFAKLDKDGNAGPPRPGDLEGEHKGNPVNVGQTHVDITIDKEH